MKYIHSFRPAVLLALFASCASAPSSDVEKTIPMESAIIELSNKLIDAARLRADLSAMRVCVHEIVPELDSRDRRLAAISDALEREFVVSLSNRINVLDLEAAKSRALSEISDTHDVTHGLVGSFYERDQDLVVTVKLVDARNQLIIAAARGFVPTGGFDVVGETGRRDEMLAVIDSRPVASAKPRREPATLESSPPIPKQEAKVAAAEAPPTTVDWVTTMGKRKPISPGEARKPIGTPPALPDESRVTKSFTPEDLAVSTGPAGRRLRGFRLKATAKPQGNQ